MRERQIIKNIENKQLQAREEYAKNKQLLSETRVMEKSTEYTHPTEIDEDNEEEKVDRALDKVSE